MPRNEAHLVGEWRTSAGAVSFEPVFRHVPWKGGEGRETAFSPANQYRDLGMREYLDRLAPRTIAETP